MAINRSTYNAIFMGMLASPAWIDVPLEQIAKDAERAARLAEENVEFEDSKVKKSNKKQS